MSCLVGHCRMPKTGTWGVYLVPRALPTDHCCEKCGAMSGAFGTPDLCMECMRTACQSLRPGEPPIMPSIPKVESVEAIVERNEAEREHQAHRDRVNMTSRARRAAEERLRRDEKIVSDCFRREAQAALAEAGCARYVFDGTKFSLDHAAERAAAAEAVKTAEGYEAYIRGLHKLSTDTFNNDQDHTHEHERLT